MLASSEMVGFVPTRDSQKAREFYEGNLEFQFVSDDPFALVVLAGENKIRIAKVPKDSTPAGDKVAWFKDPDGNVLSLAQHV